MNDITRQKRDLRSTMQQRRAEAAAQNPDAGLALRDHILPRLSLPPRSIVAGYQPFGSEIDPRPLLDALRAEGHITALPVVTGKGESLLFRCYKIGDVLASSSFGVSEPLPSAETVEPNILLVPLLAFDRAFYRLGYGGGFYDRTLNKLRLQRPIVALGIGFACQEVGDVPHGPGDARLDKIATEIQAFER